ncbi:MAG: DUF4012 domain-containing protein [Patescibacteria group bacterium]|jgi:hypothetical protein
MKRHNINTNKFNILGNNSNPKNLHVPKANIIDLRKFAETEKPEEIKEKKGLSFQKFFGNFKLPKKTEKQDTGRREAAEKVIVSRSFQPPASQLPRPEEKPAPIPPPVQKKPKRENKVTEEKLELLKFQLAPGWNRKLAYFIMACVIIVLPIFLFGFYKSASAAKGKVLGISTEAYKSLMAAGNSITSSDYETAQAQFSQATNYFVSAQQQLDEVGSFVIQLTKIVPNKAKSAQYLLAAGSQLSQAGSVITELLGNISNIDLNVLGGDNESSLIQYLLLVREKIAPLQQEISAAAESIKNVRIKDIPEEYQPEISKIQTLLPAIQKSSDSYVSLADMMLEVLGHNKSMRYLLIFQNNRELRPTGGFIGSIALVDINQGKITNLEVPGGGVYDIAGQLQEKIVAPKPLWLVNPHWNIQDANWFVDFPTSARKIEWFYERAGRATVDGVISLTPTVVEKLLDITGPIEMKDYGVTVTSDNFVREAQYWAEVQYDREENKPKKFIGDLLPILLDKIFQTDKDNIIKVVSAFGDSINSKDFLLYFNDEELQKKITDLNWDGGVKSTAKDYLNVVSTNIGGGKTDQVVDQFIKHDIRIGDDGTVTDTVTLKRVHNGNPRDRWEGQANVSYVRFYVPYGSKLIEAKGFTDIPSFRFKLPDTDATPDSDLESIEKDAIMDEANNTRLTTEFGKTVFGNWMTVDPGQAAEASITYTLPFTVLPGGLFNNTDDYSLLIQKQPGVLNDFYAGTVILPEKYKIAWCPDTVSADGQNLSFITDLVTDKYFGVLIKK